IKLKDIFETPTEITLILELVTGGELFDRIVERGFYSERDAAHVVKQILEAVSYLHSNGVVHRDLKPENLLYADLSPDAPLKIAPEILHGSPYGPEVDMWSVGVITYIFRILNCDYEFVSPWWDEVSLNAKDLVQKLIVLDPQKRLTVHQALEHPWVTGKAAKFAHMDSTQKKLQEFNARRKLKAAVKAVVASSRLGNHSHHEGCRNERHQDATKEDSTAPSAESDLFLQEENRYKEKKMETDKEEAMTINTPLAKVEKLEGFQNESPLTSVMILNGSGCKT
ncbi:Calcium/calmodulin-dependent protein kinase type IV, partial [Ophiophagus hannah]